MAGSASGLNASWFRVMPIIWKPIPGYSDYEASSNGSIRITTKHACKRPRGNNSLAPGDELKASRADGYLWSQLFNDDGKARAIPRHQLIAAAFHGARPSPRHEVCHNDGNGENNHYKNLRWDLPKGNQIDSVKLGTKRNQYGKPVFTAEQVKQLRSRHEAGISKAALAAELGVSYATLLDMINKRTYAWVC